MVRRRSIGFVLGLLAAAIASWGAFGTNCDNEGFRWSVSGTVTDRPVAGAEAWPVSTPEAEGMDAEALEAAIVELRRIASLNSLLIVRNGHLVVEEYFNGHRAEESYEIASVSKSILSALVGIAIERGLFTGVHQLVSELLPDAFEGATLSKRRITLRDLLTMQAGLVWEPVPPLDLISLQHVVADVIAQPITSGQGGRFTYSTGLPHLASAAIARVAGTSTCAFARETLFEPLGIAPEVWGRDADGVHTGGWFMYFTPRELARFGLLYLRGGEWNEEQIVPANWVRSSLSHQVSFDPFSGYGYWWWLSSYWDPATFVTYEIPSARGGGGQAIFLVPALDLVMVTTSDHAYQGTSIRFDAERFLHDVVIPAALTADDDV
jgi:CubicO group peptidase (beta-lactamase class C family)